MKAPDSILFYIVATVITAYTFYYTMLILVNLAKKLPIWILKRHLANSEKEYSLEIAECDGIFRGRVVYEAWGTRHTYMTITWPYSNMALTQGDLDKFHKDIQDRIKRKRAKKTTITHPYTPKEDNNV